MRIWCRQARAQRHTERTSRALRVAVPTLVALATAFLAVGSSQAATARGAADCRTVISGAPWKVLGSKSGSTYTLVARGMTCASARPWVVKFTHLKDTGQTLKGPSGFRCQSFSTAASGDHLVYSGVCMRGPHNHPFFGWGPKV